MPNMCEKCGCEAVEVVLPEYLVPALGIPVTVVNSAMEKKCVVCGTSEIVVPDMCGLTMAAAVSRVMIDVKLTPQEVKFLRKSLEMTAKDLAEQLEVTPETISRWENGKIPLGPSSEKLLRLMVGIRLDGLAPAVDFDDQGIINMKIMSVRSTPEPLELIFERVLVKISDKNEKKYTGAEIKAA